MILNTTCESSDCAIEPSAAISECGPVSPRAVDAPTPRQALTAYSRDILSYQLSSGELVEIEALLHLLDQTCLPVEGTRMARQLSLHAGALPPSLRQILLDFRNGLLRCGALLLTGFKVDDDRIGPSPQRWNCPWEAKETRREELYQGLVSSAAGELISWATQEGGRMFRHIVPMREYERIQLGSSSRVRLDAHTEEAHSRFRPEILSLFCMRNIERSVTTVCQAAHVALPEALRAILFQPRFLIRPDLSHSVAFPERRPRAHRMERNEVQYGEVEPCAVLTGAWSDPEIRIDPPYMSALPGDHEAAAALQALWTRLEEELQPVILCPGDLLLVDNARAVHGRLPFDPLYSDRQRWLRRCQITTDLRRSREARVHPDERQLY